MVTKIEIIAPPLVSIISGDGIIPSSSDVCHTLRPDVAAMLEVDSEEVWPAAQNGGNDIWISGKYGGAEETIDRTFEIRFKLGYS